MTTSTMGRPAADARASSASRSTATAPGGERSDGAATSQQNRHGQRDLPGLLSAGVVHHATLRGRASADRIDLQIGECRYAIGLGPQPHLAGLGKSGSSASRTFLPSKATVRCVPFASKRSVCHVFPVTLTGTSATLLRLPCTVLKILTLSSSAFARAM